MTPPPAGADIRWIIDTHNGRIGWAYTTDIERDIGDGRVHWPKGRRWTRTSTLTTGRRYRFAATLDLAEIVARAAGCADPDMIQRWRAALTAGR